VDARFAANPCKGCFERRRAKWFFFNLHGADYCPCV
jgi:hypothetical protein